MRSPTHGAIAERNPPSLDVFSLFLPKKAHSLLLDRATASWQLGVDIKARGRDVGGKAVRRGSMRWLRIALKTVED